MLSRLLKYDFRAVLKYWWIAALTSVGLSVVGGVCAVILDNDYISHFSFSAVAWLGLFLTIVGLSAFILLSQILIYVRFYRHFFSDEGYLTFTLPVKRSHLLTSKVITAAGVSVMTAIVFVADVAIILGFLQGDQLFDIELWKRRLEVVRDLRNALGGYLPLYIVEFLALLLALTVLSAMLLFCCITFAGIMVKKHKVLAAIGISYAASGVISFIMQWVFMFGLYGVDGWLSPLSDDAIKAVVALALLAFLLFTVMASVGLYIFNLWMIDRRLNLS